MLLGQLRRDEPHLAHFAHQRSVEYARLVPLQKARRDAVGGKAAGVFGQRRKVFVDVGIWPVT